MWVYFHRKISLLLSSSIFWFLLYFSQKMDCFSFFLDTPFFLTLHFLSLNLNMCAILLSHLVNKVPFGFVLIDPHFLSQVLIAKYERDPKEWCKRPKTTLSLERGISSLRYTDLWYDSIWFSIIQFQLSYRSIQYDAVIQYDSIWNPKLPTFKSLMLDYNYRQTSQLIRYAGPLYHGNPLYALFCSWLFKSKSEVVLIQQLWNVNIRSKWGKLCLTLYFNFIVICCLWLRLTQCSALQRVYWIKNYY